MTTVVAKNAHRKTIRGLDLLIHIETNHTYEVAHMVILYTVKRFNRVKYIDSTSIKKKNKYFYVFK